MLEHTIHDFKRTGVAMLFPFALVAAGCDNSARGIKVSSNDPSDFYLGELDAGSIAEEPDSDTQNFSPSEESPEIMDRGSSIRDAGSQVRDAGLERECTIPFQWFNDFQDPFGHRFYQETAPIIMTDFNKVIDLSMKHFPLAFHPQAQKAAEASECAKDQNRFWEYVDALHNNQNQFAIAKLKQYAQDLSLSTATFNHCLDSGRKSVVVANDLNEGTRKGVLGVPAFFIGSQKVEGARLYSDFEQVITEEVRALCGDIPLRDTPVGNPNVTLTLDDVLVEWKGTYNKINGLRYTITNHERSPIATDHLLMNVEGYSDFQKIISLPLTSRRIDANSTYDGAILVPHGFAYSAVTVGDLSSVDVSLALYGPTDSEMAVVTSTFDLRSGRINCNTLYVRGSNFLIGNDLFTYTGSSALPSQRPFVYFHNEDTNENVALEARETAGAVLKPTPESSYYFESTSNVNQDDFGITLISPCNDPNIACGEVISKDERFTANGIQFQYTGADRPTKTSPKIKFKRIETGETDEYSVAGPRASFVFNNNNQNYHFISASNHRVNDYSIQLDAPCGE